MDSFVETISALRERPAESVLTIWHSHRLIILSVAVAIFAVIRFVLHQRTKRPKATTTPPPSPILVKQKASQPNKGYLDEEVQSGSPKSVSVSIRPKPRFAPKRLTSSTAAKRREGSKSQEQTISEPEDAASSPVKPLIFFSSLTGSTEKRAREFAEDLRTSLEERLLIILAPEIHDLSYIDYDDYFTSPPKNDSLSSNIQYVYLILVPSYNIDTVLNNFLDHLQETHHDFRIDTAPLCSLAGYSVFGFGDKDEWRTEEEGFCSQAVQVDRWLAKLTARKRAFPLGMGDVKSDAQQRLDEWRHGITNVLSDLVANGNLGQGVPGSGDALESEDEEIDEADLGTNGPNAKRKVATKANNTASLGDLEDLGKRSNISSEGPAVAESRGLLAIDFTTAGKTLPVAMERKEMVPITSPTHAALTKQGYAIIGSHSGIKICRWTKSALRGRGSCYKFSFYGIKSHLCMETTPSLSCSNKCVFCWRHGTNPVGTTWRWKVDPPEMIFTGAKEAHLKKIKMMRGVPGVRAERFQEAMRIRHCALSLVGEPIFYPHINEFLSLLHKDRISSFLVCNAQHPEQLQALRVVTQLYVSIDASNRESLRKVDRPLHRDFWERFLKCLDIIREKRFRMRTVYRLTLVKGFNIDDEAEGYADLVARGLPCFVEVKGVTYCGTSSSAGAGLTMQNVPFYIEVVAFVEALNAALARRGLDYGIAAEHAHSCCILLASERFLIDGRWHTIIDYDKFFECLASGREFAPEDYVGPPTPEWANWGNGGFDPADERVDRKGRPKLPAGKEVLDVAS